MKRVYWRPQRVSPGVLVGLVLLALAATWAVERWPRTAPPELQARLRDAVERAALGQAALAEEAAARGIAGAEPTALMGEVHTEVTSVSGSLAAKRRSLDPRWAAVIAAQLWRAGVRPGDRVAVSCSGSFPALNLATWAALDALEAQPLVISSAAASQWGANRPTWLWIDMERALHTRGRISGRSLGASLGGPEDHAAGLSPAGRAALEAAIARNDLEDLTRATLADAAAARLQRYEEARGGAPLAAYVNVGGAAASVGGAEGLGEFAPGLTLPADAPQLGLREGSVASALLRAGVPLVNLRQLEVLAREHGLPPDPAIPAPRVIDLATLARSRALVALALLGLALLAAFHTSRGRAALGSELTGVTPCA
ncbi:MAG: poly-gamma-glutamate system protein [Planctomycetota bacterium]